MTRSSHGSRRQLGYAGAVLVAAFALAGCSATGGQASPSPPTSSTSAAPSPAVAASPTAGSSTVPRVSSGTGSTGIVTVGAAVANGLGPFLTGAGGHTLYILTTDAPNQSTCAGACAAIWPPFTVSPGATPTAGSGVSGKLGTMKRSDGSTQVTYDGRPLYYYSHDTAAGQTNGQGFAGVWYVALASDHARSAGSSASSAAPASSSSGY